MERPDPFIACVPIVFSMPGDSFVNTNGEHTNTPNGLTAGFTNGVSELLGDNTDKHLRNWQFGSLLKAVITQFREE